MFIGIFRLTSTESVFGGQNTKPGVKFFWNRQMVCLSVGCMMANKTKLMGNAAMLLAGSTLMVGMLLPVGILFVYAFLVVMMRKLIPSRRLPANGS